MTYITPDYCETIPSELWAVDDEETYRAELEKAVSLDIENTGKTHWERLSPEGQTSLVKYCSAELVEEMKSRRAS